MKKKLLGVVFLVIAVVCVVSAAREGGSKALLSGIVAGVIFAVLGIRQLGLLSKKPTPARQAAPPQPVEEPPKPVKYSFVNFSVAGVTFNNDDGANRQNIIADIQRQRPPFEDGDNLNVFIRRTTFRDKLAFDVRVNGVQIGWVPKEKVEAVDQAMQHQDVEVSGFQITGGMDGYNYGVDIALRYRSQ